MANRICCGVVVALSLVSLVSCTRIMSDCELPKDEGTCAEQNRNYYFDMTSRECRPFIWTGCGGNGNNFYTLEGCQYACHNYMNPKP